ncbi:hypothetical protein FPZ42_13695 [Mucilaginibacter achroorhodeus]|uniref:Uncharacterized protein n=1 Tax=Mucilaginibacter achroorhodeus TaxID=2599294 RepID=A0A563U2R2_9SPHI|nr:hypothetical protein [Mucilaginibacter achroorhodeus]TWR25641.1 hypothetical protein FPZ42_13695 [Mucilaginibacter achroorhodeus]
MYFFFFRKRKSTKKKTRDLVTRYYVYAIAMPVLPARYTMSHLSVASGYCSYFSLSAKKLWVKAGRTMADLCGLRGMALRA